MKGTLTGTTTPDQIKLKNNDNEDLQDWILNIRLVLGVITIKE